MYTHRIDEWMNEWMNIRIEVYTLLINKLVGWLTGWLETKNLHQQVHAAGFFLASEFDSFLENYS